MSNNLPTENGKKDIVTPQAGSSLPTVENVPDSPTLPNENPRPPIPNVSNLPQPSSTPDSLPPLPNLSSSTVKPTLPPLPAKDETEPIHLSPMTDLPPRKDGSIMVTLLIFFMLLVSGVGIYLYVAYTNLANQDVPSEINPVSYSQQ